MLRRTTLRARRDAEREHCFHRTPPLHVAATELVARRMCHAAYPAEPNRRPHAHPAAGIGSAGSGGGGDRVHGGLLGMPSMIRIKRTRSVRTDPHERNYSSCARRGPMLRDQPTLPSTQSRSITRAALVVNNLVSGATPHVPLPPRGGGWPRGRERGCSSAFQPSRPPAPAPLPNPSPARGEGVQVQRHQPPDFPIAPATASILTSDSASEYPYSHQWHYLKPHFAVPVAVDEQSPEVHATVVVVSVVA